MDRCSLERWWSSAGRTRSGAQQSAAGVLALRLRWTLLFQPRAIVAGAYPHADADEGLARHPGALAGLERAACHGGAEHQALVAPAAGAVEGGGDRAGGGGAAAIADHRAQQRVHE